MSPEKKLDLYCRAYLVALGVESCEEFSDADRWARAFVGAAEKFEAETGEAREPPRNPRPPKVLP